VVRKGSRGRAKLVASIQGTSHACMSEQLISEGILAAQGSKLIFTRDHLLASPSTAATASLDSSANGWIEWKTPQGQTLDEGRQQVVGVASQ
jgi:hypothetical protein